MDGDLDARIVRVGFDEPHVFVVRGEDREAVAHPVRGVFNAYLRDEHGGDDVARYDYDDRKRDESLRGLFSPARYGSW
ncbi:MAG: hypothetical protein AB2L13_00380 [Spirochaetota bacterium]